MNKTLKCGIFPLAILAIVSCSKASHNPLSKSGSGNTHAAAEPFVWPDSIQNIFLIPDSISFWSTETVEDDGNWSVSKLWTPEQKELARLIVSTVIDNVKVKKDKLVLDIEREDFVAQGIPEPYYDFFIERLNSLNTLEEKGFDLRGRSMEEIWAGAQNSISKVLFEG